MFVVGEVREALDAERCRAERRNSPFLLLLLLPERANPIPSHVGIHRPAATRVLAVLDRKSCVSVAGRCRCGPLSVALTPCSCIQPKTKGRNQPSFPGAGRKSASFLQVPFTVNLCRYRDREQRGQGKTAMKEATPGLTAAARLPGYRWHPWLGERGVTHAPARLNCGPWPSAPQRACTFQCQIGVIPRKHIPA